MDEVNQAQQIVEDLRQRITSVDDNALDLLFKDARSHNAWTDKPVSDEQLRNLYELTQSCATSGNCLPARFVFLRSKEAKERLLSALNPGNIPKVETAPVTTIIAYDMAFFEHLPKLFPHRETMSRYVDNEPLVEETAFRNSSIQGGYFILAARAMGLDTGPMSGFDLAKVDAEFFAGTSFKTNFLCLLGHGDASSLWQKLPRFDFDEICEII
jgi:3-hydroxypropanoate dehydrogenase